MFFFVVIYNCTYIFSRQIVFYCYIFVCVIYKNRTLNWEGVEWYQKYKNGFLMKQVPNRRETLELKVAAV